MGLVLGSMVEESLKQSILIFGNDVISGFAGRPIAMTLLLITAIGLLGPVLLRALARLRQPAAARQA
jgi:putative tricarboxylic transport membrane protein